MSTQNPTPNTTELVPTRPPEGEDAIAIGFNTSAAFELMQRVGKMFAGSSLVPKEFQGNLPNCVIALNMAQRLGADPLQVMQNLYIVHGRPGWSSQFLIATFNQNGRYTALRYEFFGKPGEDGWGCRAWSTEKATNEKLVGADITIGLAKKEGWYAKQGSKWQTMPQQMLMYRAAAWFIRAYAPEIAMGLRTAEEYVDIGPEEINVTKAGTVERIQDVAQSGSKLDALVDAAKPNGAAKSDEPAVQAAPAPQPAAPEKPKSKSEPKQQPLGNPSYSDVDQEPEPSFD
jgi:hypothetical protein